MFLYSFLRVFFLSRIKWSNPGKGVAPSFRLRCSSYWKGSLLVALDFTICQVFLFNRNYFQRSFWLTDETLINITTPDQGGPGSNSNEKVTMHSTELSNWSLTTRCSFVSYTGHPLSSFYHSAWDIVSIFWDVELRARISFIISVPL